MVQPQFELPPITIIGNLVKDPEIRYMNSGAMVATLRVASTQRRQNTQSGTYEDGDTAYLTVEVWRKQAENVVESLLKGMTVIIHGALRQRQFEREGEKRSVYEVVDAVVGVALTNQSAKVERNVRQGGAAQPARATQPVPAQGAAQPAPQPPAPPAPQPAPAAGGAGRVFDDPPF